MTYLLRDFDLWAQPIVSLMTPFAVVFHSGNSFEVNVDEALVVASEDSQRVALAFFTAKVEKSELGGGIWVIL
jgi:hypothetical protein